MSALEIPSQSFEVSDVDEPGFACTIKMYQQNSPATITMPLIRGMAYATFEFVSATPLISTIHSMLTVNERVSGNITEKRFEIVLNDNQTWLLYAIDSNIILNFYENQLVGIEPVTNVLHLAKKQAEASASAVLDAQVEVYPVGCQLQANVTRFQGSYIFNWQLKSDLSKTLLHFAFPHHRQILSPVCCQITNVRAMSASKGLMIGYLANTWILTENSLSTMDFLAPRSPTPQYKDLIVAELKKDLVIATNLTVSDYYFTGKEFHKYALLCLLAEYYRETVELDRCIRILQAGFEVLITEKNTKSLRYNAPWFGLVSSVGLGRSNVFPAGILQSPFFNKDAPKYLNYGGAVIGHEITHGFDDSGRQFDKDGNRISWWTPETIDRFIERKTCIVNQYSRYVVAQINRTLNGNQTQGENIADNGGIKESFYAYKKWAGAQENVDKKLPGLTKYSAEQMFFINYGQIWCSKMTDANVLNRILTGVHSPGEFRGGALELELAFINTNANALGISIKINPNALALLALELINA
ncbi:unnamed protein product [Rotaria sp. Silwood1]|nr:unnamed protein product [Rotaria sp. Silwood1]